ncbi:MAG: S49 family peptidase [Desulfovibrio sp.]|nr:S49 family peptidase [Desulfovibrio sp.]
MTHNQLWALERDSAPAVLNALYRESVPALAGIQKPEALVPPAGEGGWAPYEEQDGIAIISVSGVIERAARFSCFSGSRLSVGQNEIEGALCAALADASVSGILLSLDSPGGTAAGTKELADAIAAAAKVKPCAAYADGLCASAAYWLASATGRVFAPVTAQVGSIGVVAVLMDWSKAAESAGIVCNVLASGRWKAAGSPYKSLTDEERALFQGQLEQLHSIFKADVRARMGVTAPDEAWAEGQTMLAQDALALGLVTEIVQGRTGAVAALAAQVGATAKAGMYMNLSEVEARDPGLYAEMKSWAKTQADQAAEAAAAKASEETKAQVMGLLRAVAGEEVTAKVEQLASVGVTPEQMAALAPMLAQPSREETAPNDPKAAEAAARAKALEDIKAATGGALPGAAPVKEQKSPLVADAERRASEGRC